MNMLVATFCFVRNSRRANMALSVLQRYCTEREMQT